MITWGMVGNSHDASLACFIGDKPWWACMAKDFSKVDNDPHFNWTMIEAANQAYGKPDRMSGWVGCFRLNGRGGSNNQFLKRKQ